MRFLRGFEVWGTPLARFGNGRVERWDGRAWRRGLGQACDEISEDQLRELNPEAWKARNH